jgi:hypothetical protein
MTDRQTHLLAWAGALIVAGIVLLLFNFDVLARYEPTAQYIVAGVLGAGGLVALGSYFWRRDQWWRLMPGWTLIALAVMVLLSANDAVERAYIAAVLFVGLTIAFAHIYLVNRADHWWAIIPGGFMLVLAVVISLSVNISRLETLGAILFVGMGLVFGLVYLLAGKRRHWWALIPASVLILFGLLTYSVENTVQSALLKWWPAFLIVIGAGLAFFAVRRPAPPAKLPVNVAPRFSSGSSSPNSASPGTSSSDTSVANTQVQLGDYNQPAPGASVEVLPDPDHR